MDINVNMKKKVYTPQQAASAAFFGGPIASTMLIKKNFDAMANFELSRKTCIFGVVFVVCLLSLLPFLPEKFPNYLIPMLTAIFTKLVVENFQFKKEEILISEDFEFHSNWRVFGESILYMLLFLIVLFLSFALFSLLGVVK